MNIAVSVTLNNSVRWKLAFFLLSTERCVPFFTEMNLPLEVIANPKWVTFRTRAYLEGNQVTPSAQSANPAIYLTEMKLRLEDTFNQLAKDYNEETAVALHAWCTRYIVDDNVTTNLWIWHRLFYQLCETSSNKESFPTVPHDAALLNRICDIVHQYVSTEYMHQIGERIKTAETLPRSEWEEWIDNDIRLSAGQGAVLGVVDLVLDLVESIITNYRTFQIWEVLSSQLSANERDLLVVWATEAADALGIPASTIPPSFLHI